MVISEMRAWPDKNAKAGGDNNVLPTSELLFQGYEDAAQRSGVSVKGLRFVANRQYVSMHPNSTLHIILLEHFVSYVTDKC